MSAGLSLDNGRTFYSAGEIQHFCEVLLEIDRLRGQIVQLMDNDLREELNSELAPCTDMEFLVAYLERASDDMVIG